MKNSQDTLHAVALFYIIIGFIKVNKHHKYNYIEQVFCWYSLRGKSVKAYCYNLMIPVRNKHPTKLIIEKKNLENQKEVKNHKILYHTKETNKKFINMKEFEVLRKLYRLSLITRDLITKSFKKLNYFGIKKLKILTEKKHLY